MRTLADRFARNYGARPLHLLLMLVSFGLIGYAVVRMMGEGGWIAWLVLIAAAALLHDIVFLPLFSAVSSLIQRATGGVSRRGASPLLNHVRIPAILSGILLLIWFPLIFGLGSEQYERKTGLAADGYLERWLLVSGALFAASALVYLVRRPSRART